jgi:hypothetical protein
MISCDGAPGYRSKGERAKTTDADAVVAELEKMNNGSTLFGSRTF